MKVLKIISCEYGVELMEKLKKLFTSAGVRSIFEDGAVSAFIEEGEEERAAIAAADFLLEAVRGEELNKLVRLYALSPKAEKSAVAAAIEESRPESRAEAAALILSHIKENDILIPEGFIRFRMPELYEEWVRAAGRAALEASAKLELEELCGLVSLLSGARPKGMGNMRLLLLPDGSAVLSDDTGCRIECMDPDEAVISALVDCFRPETLTVYDLSPEGMPGLRLRIREVYGKNAVVFVPKRGPSPDSAL